jgi:nitrilase
LAKQTVVVVQAGSLLFDTRGTLNQMEALCWEAQKSSPRLIVFPEAYIGGYPKGFDFGARIGSRTAAGRDEFLGYWQSAIDVPGPEVRQMARFAKMANAYLVVGVIERGGSTLFCSALSFGPDGNFLGRRRKLIPTGSERLIWGAGNGATLRALQTEIGRVAVAICWENYMPSLRMAMYAQDVAIWCAPTVDDREIWQSSMRHIAYEGRCFVLSACQYVHEVAREGARGIGSIKGGSVIVGPLGDVLAGPVYGREAILCAEIDLDDIVRGKFDLDVTGHYARPDVFELRVDERPRFAVTLERYRNPHTPEPIELSTPSETEPGESCAHAIEV